MIFAHILILMLTPGSNAFDLQVARGRTPRSEPGNLHIDSKGIAFQSRDGKTTINIPMADLREADVADPRALRFQTYEVRKWRPTERLAYLFRALPDAPVEAIAEFLSSHIRRPIIGHYSQSAQHRIAAYHRRTFSGSNGVLEIGNDGIQFVSDKPADSRIWLYRDIETIGRPDLFRLRVTTNRETYILELKDSLPDAAYNSAWGKVYHLALQSLE